MIMNKNRIVVFSNIKGGVGKTTLAECFAHYLAINGEPVAVVDADIQQTLFHDVQADKLKAPGIQPPWDCIPINTLQPDDTGRILRELKKIPGYVIIDCPGNLQDPSLEQIFRSADVIVTPVAFDRKTLDGTGTFVKVLKSLRIKARIIFVPNRIVTTENNAAYVARREEAKQTLGMYGTVTPRVKQSVIFNRIDTFVPLDSYQFKAVEYAFKMIVEQIEKL